MGTVLVGHWSVCLLHNKKQWVRILLRETQNFSAELESFKRSQSKATEQLFGRWAVSENG